jgi:hypothetical protein
VRAAIAAAALAFGLTPTPPGCWARDSPCPPTAIVLPVLQPKGTPTAMRGRRRSPCCVPGHRGRRHLVAGRPSRPRRVVMEGARPSPLRSWSCACWRLRCAYCCGRCCTRWPARAPASSSLPPAC